MKESNISEGEQKVHRLFRKDNGLLTAELVFKDIH